MTRTLETDIAAPMVAYLKGEGLEVREEPIITLSGQAYPADVIARCVEPEGTYWTVVEVKPSLTPKVMEQAERWIPHAHVVMVAVKQPQTQSKQHKARRCVLANMGIGLVYACDGADGMYATIVQEPVIRAWGEVDPRPIEAAFARQPEDIAAAGSAGAPRVTPARSKWYPATELVRENPGEQWKWLKPSLPVDKFGPVTPAQARKAVLTGEWRGVEIRDIGGAATFWPEGDAR